MFWVDSFVDEGQQELVKMCYLEHFHMVFLKFHTIQKCDDHSEIGEKFVAFICRLLLAPHFLAFHALRKKLCMLNISHGSDYNWGRAEQHGNRAVLLLVRILCSHMPTKLGCHIGA